MKEFAHLASRAELEWKGDLAKFPQLATRLLQDFKYSSSLEELNEGLKKWLLNQSSLPKQISIHNSFGQPSVTLFNNGQFLIDLYFWVDFDTSIHSHGFRGAFRVLHGQSLQETFKTPTLKKIAEDIRFVDMSNPTIERLKTGDVRTIEPGLELTHRVIHLENPTVTLCLRTVNETELKQWTYLTTGLAVQKNEVSTDLLKKVLYFQYLLGQNEAMATEFLNELFNQLSLSEQIHLYEDIASGAAGLNSAATQMVTELFVERHEKSEWWEEYEESHVARMNEIHFEDYQEPVERLLSHFINCSLTFNHAKPLLGEMTKEEAREKIQHLSPDWTPEQKLRAVAFLA